MEFSLSSDAPAPEGPAALQQHPAYARAAGALGATARVFTATAGGHTVASARMLERRAGPVRALWLPRGPLWHRPAERGAVLSGLAATAGRRTALIACPDRPEDAPAFAAAGFRALLTPQYVAEIDLTRPPAERLAAQHGKWRNRLRRAGRAKLELGQRAFDPVRDVPLLAREAAQRRRRRYAALPPAFTQSFARQAGAGAARLFAARTGGTVLAFMVILLHAPTATYHIGWTGEAGRRLCCHNALLWEAAGWLAGRGYARLDLGAVDTETAPGLARFKIGSGARVRPLGPTMLRLPLPRWPRRRRPAA